MSTSNLNERMGWLRTPLLAITFAGTALAALLLIAIFAHQTRLPAELQGKIAFVSSPGGGDANILLFDIGSGATRSLTNMSFAENEDPAWSPDGSRIAFSSYRDGNREIYVINADGTGLKRLTTNQVLDEFPFWSPDGEWIGFTSNNDLYIMRPDGTEQTLLIAEENGRVWGSDWSPDGKKILYQADVEGHFEIYVANADGSRRTRLTYTDRIVENGGARWSPDGKKIVFTRLKSVFEIFVMNADGSNQTFLVKGAAADWSPDGNWIVFRRQAGRNKRDDRISIIGWDGGGVIDLIKSSNYTAQPMWSP